MDMFDHFLQNEIQNFYSTKLAKKVKNEWLFVDMIEAG
jgi:hypothetical protein